MTWEPFFLACFTVGLVLGLIGFLAGSAHLHFHIGHGHVHTGSGGVSKFNFGTVAAFLTWFGGGGYILSSWGRIGLAFVLIGAIVIGRVGAVIIFVFAAKVLAPGD